MEAGCGIRQGHAVDAVFDLPTIAVVLPFHTGRLGAALGGSRFVDAADGFWMRVFAGDDLLAAITQPLLTPHQAFEEPLERARRHLLIQGDGLSILALHAGQQPPHINQQQRPPSRPRETIRKPTQKLTQQFAQLCDILHRHRTTLRGFRVKLSDTRRVVLFSTPRQGR